MFRIFASLYIFAMFKIITLFSCVSGMLAVSVHFTGYGMKDSTTDGIIVTLSYLKPTATYY